MPSPPPVPAHDRGPRQGSEVACCGDVDKEARGQDTSSARQRWLQEKPKELQQSDCGEQAQLPLRFRGSSELIDAAHQLEDLMQFRTSPLSLTNRQDLTASASPIMTPSQRTPWHVVSMRNAPRFTPLQARDRFRSAAARHLARGRGSEAKGRRGGREGLEGKAKGKWGQSLRFRVKG